MIEKLKFETIKNLITTHFEIQEFIIEEPKKGDADLAIPLFSIAKEKKQSPKVIFDLFEPLLRSIDEIENVVFLNGFLNIYLKKIPVSKQILSTIIEEDNHYGNSNRGWGKTVVMDYSSPNIAKSFSVGHLRSTMIGNALKKIYQKTGYNVVAINHLGDWGTQFGKMIVAYQKWGDKSKIQKNPIVELQKLYVKFHEEEKKDPSLEQAGRDAFLELERKNPTYEALWTYFKEESLKDFMNMYDMLGVSFDSFAGEAFYNDKMDAVVDELTEKALLRLDEGATIVDLGSDLPPALIKKSDGATLYITRDIAALLYRFHTYHFDKILYVVGNEQKLHFTQLKKVTDLMGYDFDLHHINFGLVLVEGKKMSTRGGKTTRLEEVVLQAIDGAKAAINEKNPQLEHKDDVAKAIGVGAIIFNDLKNERHLDIDFNLENMLKFEGQTGPYLQYSGVRIKSILRDNPLILDDVDDQVFNQNHYFDMVKLLGQFPTIILKAMESNAPNIISRYVLNLAQSFNRFMVKNVFLWMTKDKRLPI
jgi:arginyl-tRNA synthetase